MPEKVHKKFTDESNTSKSPSSGKPGANERINKSSLYGTTPATNGNVGLKRDQDGKHKLPSSTAAQSQPKRTIDDQNKKQEDSSYDGSGRARKSPKLNGTNGKKENKTESNSGLGRDEKDGKEKKAESKSGPEINAKHVNASSSSLQLEAKQEKLKNIAKSLQAGREALSVSRRVNNIRHALQYHDVLLLHGATGSGKSTQVPQALYNQSWCKGQRVTVEDESGRKAEAHIGGVIAITQPRQIAATTVAQRVAAEMGQLLQKGSHKHVPGLVGYAIRFEHVVPKGAKIKFVTEGILLQELKSDPNLRQYSCVIVDEVHERSKDCDLILGMLRTIHHGDKKGRGGVPLKVVMMSATLDKGGLEAFMALPGTHPAYVPGNSHGKVLARHMTEEGVRLNTEEKYVKKLAEKDKCLLDSKNGVFDESRRLSLESEYSDWSGISGSTQGQAFEAIPEAGTPDKIQSKALEEGLVSSGAIADTPAGSNAPPTQTAPKGVKISPTGVAWEYCSGRQYPVEILMEKAPVPDYVRAAKEVILQQHVRQPLPGDILCFLTGQEEIESLKDELEKYIEQFTDNVPKLEIKVLYGSLSAQEQQASLTRNKNPSTIRKVILATNIAETSLTVPGVHHVVDCGKVKQKKFRPHLGMETLLVVPISKVSAIQRMGRAGREAKGTCIRLYTNAEYDAMDQDEEPEILRSDVLGIVLNLKAGGIDNVFDFPLMDQPNLRAMEEALKQLLDMGALDQNGKITTIGLQMSRFPLPPTHARVLIAAADESADCLLEVIDILACLNTDPEIFQIPRSEDERDKVNDTRSDIYRREGDLITLLTTMQRYAAETTNRLRWCEARNIHIRAMKYAYEIRKQLRQICLDIKIMSSMPPPDPQEFSPVSASRAETVMKTFLSAFSKETAILSPDGSYRTTGKGNEIIKIHPSSVLYGKKVEAIVFLQHVFTQKNWAKKVGAIQADWLTEHYRYWISPQGMI